MDSPFLQQGHTAWVRASVADVRATPAHGAEQINQALQGEECRPRAHENGWLQVVLPDGYEGWIRDWHLVVATGLEVAQFAEHVDARIQVPWTVVRSSPRADAAPVAETLFGTRVHLAERIDGWVQVHLPTGLHGWLPAAEVRAGAHDWQPQLASILAMLEGFLGVPYVWGGRSPKGFDCSGLVQFVYGLHGLQLPRDSPDQFAQLAITQNHPHPGDLLFFGEPDIGHVAVQFDAQRYLHARGTVRFNSLDPQHPLYDAALAQQYRGTARVLTHSPPDRAAT